MLKNITHSHSFIKMDDSVTFDENGYCVPHGMSFIDPAVCSAVLCNYSKLKMDAFGNFEKDTWFFMEDFDEICQYALQDYPLYERIV